MFLNVLFLSEGNCWFLASVGALTFQSQILKQVLPSEHSFNAGIIHFRETSANNVSANGLVEGHAYAVTGVTQVISNGQPINLVRLLNPWGNGEWIGDWSDSSVLWQSISAEDREMCVDVADDGEFWMAMEDFCSFFSDLDICCLCPDFLDGTTSSHWTPLVYESRWVAGTTAGGCLNNPGT
ncbi:unnamed protein product [Arctogadus glacialis]